MKQLDVPLSDTTFAALRQAAEERREPIAVLARRVIDTWLDEQQKEQRRAAIREYAEQLAGSEEDLDEVLEQAAYIIENA